MARRAFEDTQDTNRREILSRDKTILALTDERRRLEEHLAQQEALLSALSSENQEFGEMGKASALSRRDLEHRLKLQLDQTRRLLAAREELERAGRGLKQKLFELETERTRDADDRAVLESRLAEAEHRG